MPVQPHIRCTAIGDLPGGEIFSYSLALGVPDALGPGPSLGDLLDPNDTVWDDLRDDFDTFHQNNATHPEAVLRRVKFASLVPGPEGHPIYDAPPVEREVNGGTGRAGGAVGSARPPNQVALAVTLHTAGDLGRVKGRFYLPLPGTNAQPDGRIGEGSRDAIETAAQVFVNNINNQPGIDVLNLRVMVASAGRHNRDGSVKIPGRNHVVTAVSVGRTLDTIRRRRNKLTEFRGTPSTVS